MHRKKCKYDPETGLITCCKINAWTGEETCEVKTGLFHKKRGIGTAILIIALTFIVLFVPVLIAQWFTNAGITPQDVYLFRQENVVTYRYQNGSLGSEQELVMTITPDGDYTDGGSLPPAPGPPSHN